MNWIAFDILYGKYLLCMTDCRILFEVDPRKKKLKVREEDEKEGDVKLKQKDIKMILFYV